jgi:O-antigen/teichoic acid export membrane protein
VAVYKIYILASAKSVLWFAFSTSLDFLIIAILLIFVYPNQGGPRLSFSWTLAKNLLKNSYHFILSSFFVLIYTQMDKLMIEAFYDETQVGYYGIATSIYNYWALVLTALINAVRPSIISAKSVNEGEYIKRLKRLYALLAYGCFAAALFFTFFGKYLIPLVYGDAYIPSVSAVTITMWYAAFSLIGTARGIWIVCEDKNKYVKYYVMLGAAANFVLNYILIPAYGINGAAIATLLTQIITCVIAPMLFRETRIHTKYVLEAFLLKGLK